MNKEKPILFHFVTDFKFIFHSDGFKKLFLCMEREKLKRI